MDKLVSILVALGTPGLVLLVFVSTSGLAGAASMTTSLAILGGPFGILGGIMMLPILALISKVTSEVGIEIVIKEVLKGLYIDKGLTKEEICETIHKYPISKDMKFKLQDYVQRLG